MRKNKRSNLWEILRCSLYRIFN